MEIEERKWHDWYIWIAQQRYVVMCTTISFAKRLGVGISHLSPKVTNMHEISGCCRRDVFPFFYNKVGGSYGERLKRFGMYCIWHPRSRRSLCPYPPINYHEDTCLPCVALCCEIFWTRLSQIAMRDGKRVVWTHPFDAPDLNDVLPTFGEMTA